MHDAQWTEIGNIVSQCYAGAGDERCRYTNDDDAIPCKYNWIDTLLMHAQFGEPVINYSNVLGLKTPIYKGHSCIQRSPPWNCVSPYSVPEVTPKSTPSPVVLHGFGQACKWQMDNGRPGSPRSPCLIHEQGSA